MTQAYLSTAMSVKMARFVPFSLIHRLSAPQCITKFERSLSPVASRLCTAALVAVGLSAYAVLVFVAVDLVAACPQLGELR